MRVPPLGAQTTPIAPERASTPIAPERLSIWLHCVAGTLVLWVAGALLHFLFDWTGCSHYVALFSAVNESVWEHVKIMLWPMVLWWFAFGKTYQTILSYIAVSTYSAAIFMVVVNTYLPSTLASNLILFAVSILFGNSVVILTQNRFITVKFSMVMVSILFYALLSFSFQAPEWEHMFLDPVSKTYGIPVHCGNWAWFQFVETTGV
jgi:hypothetical protein